MARNQRAAAGPPTTPQNFPDSVPVYYPSQDHSFTLQAIMEMQKTLGELTSETKATGQAVNKLEVRVEKMEQTISGVTHKLYAAGVILVILLAIGGFIVDKAWSLMEDQIKAKALPPVTAKP